MDTERFCQHCGKPLGAKAVHGLCPECLMQVGMGSEPGVEGGPKGFVPPAAEELAPHFPQLENLEFHGKGGMGAVYRARQKNLNRLVALKVLPPNAGRDPAFAERFTREAQALAQLSHPGILTIHEFGHAGGFYYFVMEFVDGVNLRQLLRTQRLSPREAMAIVPQICEALQYAHDHGIVHRDIKPENVLVDKQGRVKIADFGLAKLLGREGPSVPLTRPAEVMGTPQYMAPEQLERPLEVDHRADIYSLGVVFYEMLTGELPLGRFPAPSRKVQVDVRLDEIVLRALEKEPELRYQQASVFKTEVETVAQTPGPGSPTAARAFQPRANRSEARTTWYGPLALGLFLVGTLGTLALLSLSPREEPALVFGALALVLAVVFGWMSRRERLGRIVLFALGGAACLAGAVAAVWFLGFMPIYREMARREMARKSEMRQEAARLRLAREEEARLEAARQEQPATNALMADAAAVPPDSGATNVPAEVLAGMRAGAPAAPVFAWRSVDPFIPPDFESYFPDDVEGGRRLDLLWRLADKNSLSDAEILDAVRLGLRRTEEQRSSILSWIGDRYIRGQLPQHPEAIELMYHAADPRGSARSYGIFHDAVYHGLSLVEPKTPAILQTLASTAMALEDPNHLDRIAWGVRGQKTEFLGALAAHHASDDPASRAKALLVQQMVVGQTNAFTWAEEVARQQAEAQRRAELPRVRKMLSSGASRERKDALELIARERLTLLMDDEFIRAYARCAEDGDRTVRNDVARQVGERWIESAERQHPEAIELMLHLSRDPDHEVRHSAMYFGLSTILKKDDRVLRRMLELALADQEMDERGSFGRIVWGVRDQREQAARILDEYLERAEHAEAAHRVYERITGRRPPRGRPIPADRARVERELEARYQAALQITLFSQADAALRAVAVDAAKAGVPATAIKALKKITFFSVGDSAAVEVTTHLVKAKLYADALEAAKGITAFSRKDEALRIVAQGAAAGGDHAMASKAVEGMTSFSARDEAAAEAARELAKKGYAAEAIELAKTITVFSKRDALLRELAEGRSTRTNPR